MPWGCSHRAPTDGTPRMSPTLLRLDPAALPAFGQDSLCPGEVSVPRGAAGGHLQAACAGLAGLISGRLRSIAHTGSTGQEPPRCSQRWGGAAEHVSAAGTGTRSGFSAKKVATWDGNKTRKEAAVHLSFSIRNQTPLSNTVPRPCTPLWQHPRHQTAQTPTASRGAPEQQSNSSPRGCNHSRQHHGDLRFCVCHEMWQPQCSSGHGAQHPQPPQGLLALPVRRHRARRGQARAAR